ncbi:MAG TPA: hypothetical protein VIM96_07545 [Pseudomonadales bacterium]|jgi:hypothetical protein
MSDDSSTDAKNLTLTLARLADAIERLNGLVEGLAIELTDLSDEMATEYEAEPGQPRTLH